MKKELNAQLIELNFVENEVLKISPVGDIVAGIDGRVYNIDGNKILESLKKANVDLVLDLNHMDGEAMGWFDKNSFEVRKDGIYAKLNLTEVGKEKIDKKLFRYLSPAYIIDGWTGDVMNVKSIDSVGLVNRPNLLDNALNNKEKEENMPNNNTEIDALKSENEELKKRIAELEKLLKDMEESTKEANKIAKNNILETMVKNGEILEKHKSVAVGLEGNALKAYLEVCKSETTLLTQKNSTTLDINKDESIDENVKKQLGL